MVTIVALKFAMSSHFPLPKIFALFGPTQVVRLFFPSKKWIKLIPKTIGNRKGDCAWGCARVINTIRENLQIASTNQEGVRFAHQTDLCFAICRFSRMVFIPRAQPHAQSLFSISNSFWYKYTSLGPELFESLLDPRRIKTWRYWSLCENLALSNNPNMATVKEEIFVGEKFRTFPSKTFRMELNFVLSNWPKTGKTRKDDRKACKPCGRNFGMEINFVQFWITSIRKLRN